MAEIKRPTDQEITAADFVDMRVYNFVEAPIVEAEAAGISLTALHDVDALVFEPRFEDGGFPRLAGARVGLGAFCAEGPRFLRINLVGGQVADDPRLVQKLRALRRASRDAEPDAVGDGEQRRQAEPGTAAPNPEAQMGQILEREIDLSPPHRVEIEAYGPLTAA